MRKILFITLSFFILSYTFLFSQKKIPNFWDDEPNMQLAKKIISEMTDEELLAQTLMFSWKGQKPRDLIISWVKDSGLGSIKLFGWNTGNTKLLAQSIILLQKKALETRFSIPLFVATDQEGGWVRHVKGKTSITPGNLAIGASGLPYDAYYSGYYIAKELRELGINLNFAPTVDLLTNQNSTIIGTRAFSDNPEIAGILGVAFMKGCLAAGVLPTAKHFPGHGDTSIDSHGMVPQINLSKKILNERELIPFKKLINAGVPIVMIGHLNFPQIMKKGEPATFSNQILHGLLRKKLGFEGLIITDDMMMKGALKYAGNFSKAVKLALLAGNNIIEASKTPKKYEAVWQENLHFLKTDIGFKKCVQDSAYRIVLAKLRYFKSKNYSPIFPNPNIVGNKIPNKNGQKFFLSLAARATTMLGNKYLPYIPKKNEKILLISNRDIFFKLGRERFKNADTAIVNQALKYSKYYDTIIFCLENNYSANVLKILQKKYPNKKYIIVSIMSPAFLNQIDRIETGIAIYSDSPASLKAGFAAICGDFKPTGKMPIQNIK